LLKVADDRLLDAKRGGRSQVVSTSALDAAPQPGASVG
jgi:hypothetical protein